MKSFSYTSIQLKWIAIITMTIDHFGVMVLMPYQNQPTIGTLYVLARLIGRIAFPLFGFMIAEGMMRSRHRGKYLLRLGLMAVLIAIAMWGLGFFNLSVFAGNIFIDLFMAALAMWFLLKKRWWQKLFAILPVIYVIFANLNQQFPNPIKPDYGIYGMIMMLMFFVILTTHQHWKRWSLSWFKNPAHQPRQLINMSVYQIASIALLIMHLVWYIMYIVSDQLSPFNQSIVAYLSQYAGAQSYAVFAGYFIFYYYGDKGKAPTWFQAFTYVYYPLHFILLYGVYLLTTI
jgi:hypothetical protein